MFVPHIENETATLREVILGIAEKIGPAPSLEDAYDPKSKESILLGQYPSEEDMVEELNGFERVLKKYKVNVHRPQLIENYNQIFVRDIGFVIGDVFIKSNILPQRDREFLAIKDVVSAIDPTKVITLPEDAHIEGGDVVLWKDYIFVGTYSGSDYSTTITARTNRVAVECLKTLFPKKQVFGFDLVKSNTNAKKNALHLDCCFQPIGKDKAIVHKNGFQHEEDYNALVRLFKKENMFHVDDYEMYCMFCNVFSISENVVVSEKSFTRLNRWLLEQGFVVEAISFSEISKQEGLLRCSTLPLLRVR